MDSVPALLALAGVWAVVVISPGPCFLATVQQATRGTSRDGVWVALGIGTGTILQAHRPTPAAAASVPAAPQEEAAGPAAPRGAPIRRSASWRGSSSAGTA